MEATSNKMYTMGPAHHGLQFPCAIYLLRECTDPLGARTEYKVGIWVLILTLALGKSQKVNLYEVVILRGQIIAA